jgi:predicted transcriptional regulator of viral defense system
MQYQSFKNQVRGYPIITGGLLNWLGEDERVLRNQLSRWNKQGLIVQLKRGLYLLNRNDRVKEPSRFFLANQLVFPSYVSLESALSYYHLIPEAVYQITSVTTGKPAQYVSPEGDYAFRHVKESLFFGFDAIRDERGFEVFMAEPEKALLDFFYLNLPQFSPTDAEVFSESYRFLGQEILQPRRLAEYASRFASKKLQQITQLFIKTYFTRKAHARRHSKASVAGSAARREY